MMHLTAVVGLFTDLDATELAAWIDRGWLDAVPGGTDPVFQDMDVARVRLIHDLRTIMRIEDETIPLVLSLLDQVYETRGRLHTVLRAVDAQPATVREAILTRMR